MPLLGRVALVGAAMDSPFAVHRLPTLCVAWRDAFRGLPSNDGGEEAGLSSVIDAAVAKEPAAIVREDWWPSDPRQVVRVRFRGRRWRLHPGRSHEPLDVFEELVDASASVDARCAARFGFRAHDLIEVVLRYGDAEVRHMAAAWPNNERNGPPVDRAQTAPEWFGARVREIPAQVTKAEVQAARRWWAVDRLGAAAAAATEPAAALRAIEWATCDAADLVVDPLDTALDPTLRVRSERRCWAYPASMMISRLSDCVLRLLAELASEDTDRTLRNTARSKTEALLGVRPTYVGSVAKGGDAGQSPGVAAPERDPDLVLAFGRRVITVDIVPTTRPGKTQRAVVDAHGAALGRDFTQLLTRVGRPERQDVVPLRLLVTHGPIDVKPIHAGGFAAIPLVALRRILRDADADEAGRNLVWQFLEDLVHLEDHVDAILPSAAEDLWTHWRRYGGFLPVYADVDGPPRAVLVAPTLYDPDWGQAAELEPAAALADLAGLPDVRRMPSVSVGERGRAVVWGNDGSTVIALGPPAVVVAVDTASAAGLKQVDSALAAALAVALRDALLDSGLGEALAGADGIYRLALTLCEHLSSPDDAEPAAGQMSGTVDGGWNLILTLDVLRRLVTSPRDVHVALGHWIAQPSLQHPDVRIALDCWLERPELLTLDSYRPPAEMPPPGVWMSPTAASRTRAQRAVAAAIPPVDRLPPGRHDGVTAHTFCRSVFLPAALRTLHAEIKHFDRDAALVAAVAAVDAAYAERAIRRRAIDVGLASRDAASVRTEVRARPDDAALTRPAELLVEEVLASVPPHGHARPDRFDLADLTALAQLVLEAGIGADMAARQMAGVEFVTTEGGGTILRIRTDLKPEPEESTDGQDAGAVDVEAWLGATLAYQLEHPAVPDVIDPAAEPLGDVPFRPVLAGDDVPTDLRRTEGLMRARLGWGIDTMVAVLATTIASPGQAVPERSYGELVDDIVRYSRQPRNEVARAVDFLTLRAQDLANDRRFWEQERRAHRLFLKPLVESGDGVLVIPRHLVRALQEVMAEYLGEGRLVWPDVPQDVRDAVNAVRKTVTTDLETVAAEAVERTGLPFRANLEPHDADQAGIQGLPGEIDLLVCDPARAVLWVVEVKHHIHSASPYSVTKRAERFLKPRKGYVAKLAAKAAVIARHPDLAATLVDGGDGVPPLSWTVRAVMATQRVEPAAFTRGQLDVAFVTVDNLAEHLGGEHRAYGLDVDHEAVSFKTT